MTHRTTDPATSTLLAAQDGDAAAFERFIEHTSRDVTKYCRYLGDPEHLEDLVQDTYLRALRGLHGYRSDGSATRWLLGIARRVCADAIHHSERARRTELTRSAPTDETATVDLQLLIASLPDDQRQAFVLTQVLGYTYQEAADIRGSPIGTIRSRVARSRASLAERLEVETRAG